MTTTTENTTSGPDVWAGDGEDDAPLRPDGESRHPGDADHRIEQSVLVYLRLSRDGSKWLVDSPTVDGYALDAAFSSRAHNEECYCQDEDACEKARAAADQLPLPTARELAKLIIDAIG